MNQYTYITLFLLTDNLTDGDDFTDGDLTDGLTDDPTGDETG